MNFVNIGEGYLKLESQEAVNQVNQLLDDGEFWEYISVLIEKGMQHKESNMEDMMKLLQKLQNDMSSVKTKLDNPNVAIQAAPTASINSTQPSTTEPVKEVPKEVPKALPKAKSSGKPKPKGGILGRKRVTGRQ